MIEANQGGVKTGSRQKITDAKERIEVLIFSMSLVFMVIPHLPSLGLYPKYKAATPVKRGTAFFVI